MSGRFDLRPLLGGARDGLRKRRIIGKEPVDKVARVVLIGVPSAVFVVVLATRFILGSADQLIAGLALLAAAFLATFAQVASWRERLTARDRKIDEVPRKALDEAVAHILISAVVSVIATVAMMSLANFSIDKHSSVVELWAARGLSALGCAAVAYLFLTMIVVVNLLWDGYVRANPNSSSSNNHQTH